MFFFKKGKKRTRLKSLGAAKIRGIREGGNEEKARK